VKEVVTRGPRWLYAAGSSATGHDRVNSAISDLFKKIQTNLNLIRSKDGLPELKKFQIKYGIEEN
jgi:hypothetical protein